jgi:chemotaxis protein MotB
MRARSVLVVVVALASACGVKKETHQKVLDELTATRAELDETRRQRDELSKEKSSLSGELDKTSAEKGKLAKDKEATEAELAELRKQREASEKRLAAFRQLQDRFRALVDTGKLEVGYRNGQMVLKLPSGILFASGKGELSKDGQAALAEVLGVLAEFKDRRFVVAGHTDTDPIKSRQF